MQTGRILKATLSILLIASFSTSYAYNLKRISKKDGLSNSAITSLAQDRYGFMWLGTVDGVNTYDGTNVDRFKPFGSNSVSGNVIDAIHHTSSGNIWLVTNYGIDRLDVHSREIKNFREYKANYKLREARFAEMFFIREDLSLVWYDGVAEELRHTPIDCPVAYDGILDYFADSEGNLWIAGHNGACMKYSVTRHGDGLIVTGRQDAVLSEQEIAYCFHEDATFYYIDSYYTLYSYNTATAQKTYIYNIHHAAAGKSGISSFLRYNEDYFIGFYTDGLVALRHTPEKSSKYETEIIDINVGVFSLLHDRKQDTIWIGTDGQGAYIYYEDSFSLKSFPFESFTRTVNKPVRSFARDRHNSLWIATKGDGIIRIRDFEIDNMPPQKVDYFTAANSGLGNNSVFKLQENRDRNLLWIGNDEGIDYYSYSTGTIRHLADESGSGSLQYVHGIFQPSDTVMWVGTVGTGIYKLSLGWRGGTPYIIKKEKFSIKSGGMSSNYFFSLYPENDSTLWFGNRGYGLFRINTMARNDPNISLNDDANARQVRSVRFDRADGSRMLNDIYCAVKGPGNNLWVGTGGGLVKYTNRGEFEVFDERDGFPNACIHGILRDSQGSLWLSTNEGIVKFMPENNTLLSFNESHGLDVVEFSDGAFYRDEKNNTMFFGGINGFVTITEQDYRRNEFIPAITPIGLSIFGEAKNLSDYMTENRASDSHIELNHGENFFSIAFAATDYIYGNNYSFLYQLEGQSDTWIDNGSSRNIVFTNLSPGDYKLHVKFRNREARIESAPYTMHIRIRPPWYASNIANAVYVLLAAVLIAAGVDMLRRRSENRHTRALEKLESEHQKDIYESKLRFFTNIAHEFCTPLTLIYGPCERILAYEKSDMLVRQYASVIKRNTGRLNDLIQDLIEFRRIETGNKAPVISRLNVSELLGEIAANFDVMAESRGVSYSRSLGDSVQWNSDSGFLFTIITNLISNAFKYTNEEGSISVSLDRQDDRLRITVSNTGKGIRQEDIERIFDRYTIIQDLEESNDNKDIRNGLGLAISYNMVGLLGGRIKVKSVRHGTTDFIVTLPQLEVTDSGTGETAAIAPPPVTGPHYEEASDLPQLVFDKTKPTILAIDDERDMLWFISDIFSSEFNVITTDKPLELEKILAETLPNVIISDVVMPDRTGIEITGIVKSNPQTAHIPLILVSANHLMEEQIAGLEAGAEMYITKPFDTNYLRTFVRHLIDRKETLKEYFSSPISAYELTVGKLTHKEHRRFIHRILEIISNNLTDKNLSAKFIADKLNISTRQLYRKLQEIGAESPLDMIRECRLHVSEYLLLNTTLTIDEIIYKSGFSNRSPFFKAFTAKYGCTPKEYRKERKGMV